MSLDKIKIEKTSKGLLGHFDPEARVEVSINSTSCMVSVDTEMSGLLIGRHGETLESLQHLLRLILAKEVEEFVPLVLDICQYRSLRMKDLENTAKKAADQVKLFGGTETLPPMSAYERRLIHLLLEEMDGVETFSEGEEPYRRIVIRPKI